MKSSSNQSKNIKKGNKGRLFNGRCNHCGKYGNKKADCWDLKNKQESGQENERKGQKEKSKVRCYKCKKLGHCANECKNEKNSSGNEKHVTWQNFAIWHTSGCLMVDVPYLDHLWDGQKDCLHVGQDRCFHEETSRKTTFLEGRYKRE